METKVIVAGSRTFNDIELMENVLVGLSEEYEAMSIVSGCAKGADKLAIDIAKKYQVQLYTFPANWSMGKSAGYVRNIEMADFADVLVAFWDGQSKGTEHMIKAMQNRNKRTLVYGF